MATYHIYVCMYITHIYIYVCIIYVAAFLFVFEYTHRIVTLFDIAWTIVIRFFFSSFLVAGWIFFGFSFVPESARFWTRLLLALKLWFHYLISYYGSSHVEWWFYTKHLFSVWTGVVLFLLYHSIHICSFVHILHICRLVEPLEVDKTSKSIILIPNKTKDHYYIQKKTSLTAEPYLQITWIVQPKEWKLQFTTTI